MIEIKDYSREELAAWLQGRDIRPFRAGQIFKWLYLKQTDSFDAMTDIGKEVRELLHTHFTNQRLVVEQSEISTDGTEKLLFRLADGNRIESVLIPQKDHYTLCISSQAGCAQGCRFCLTATCGFQRNLTVSEIVSQVRDARRHLEQRDPGDTRPLSNIVFMGMGEPLANYDAVVKSMAIITDSDFGLKFSSRRVTVSTCGLVPEIIRLGNDTQANLAISLNATTDEVRSTLMPVNRRYPIRDLLEACRNFIMKPRNKITFEYILIKGVNDSEEDAKRLVRMLSPLKAKINLIPFNEHEKSQFKRPSPAEIDRFFQILLASPITVIIRKSMGNDISAACGQLRARHG
ncbi:MAG: 23S rRNA (adenine(2503)-C(2))-methyltransferase RlmN [Pseudomonadota bacterium]